MGSRPRLSITFSSLASADVREAIAWYEGEQAGLGMRFRSELRARLDLLKVFPSTGERVDGEIRRVLLVRFPYAVFYEPRENGIRVYAVIHTAQDDGAWRGRLPK